MFNPGPFPTQWPSRILEECHPSKKGGKHYCFDRTHDILNLAVCDRAKSVVWSDAKSVFRVRVGTASAFAPITSEPRTIRADLLHPLRHASFKRKDDKLDVSTGQKMHEVTWAR